MNRTIFKFLIIFSILICSFIYHLNESKKLSLPNSLEDKRIFVVGKVISFPEGNDQYRSFCFQIKSINSNILDKKITVKLYWFKFNKINNNNEIIGIFKNTENNEKLQSSSSAQNNRGIQSSQNLKSLKTNSLVQTNSQEILINLKKDDELQLLVSIKKPHGYINPGGFDESLWDFSNNIQGVGYVIDSNENKILALAKSFNVFDFIRKSINNNIDFILFNSQYKGFIKAITTGVRNDISKEQWNVLSSTGTNHLVAVAGLHIEFICFFFYIITGLIWKFFVNSRLYIYKQDAKIISGLVITFIYASLAGFLIPTQRALIMMFFYGILFLTRRNKAPFSIVLWSAIIINLYDPFVVLTESFWLSFYSLILITYGFYGKRFNSILKNFLWMQVVLTIGLLPLTVLFFKKLSLVSCLANFVVVPFFGIVIIPLSFIAVMCSLFCYKIASLLLNLDVIFLKLIWYYLCELANQREIIFEIATLKWWPIFLMVLGTLILLAPRRFPLKYIGLLGLLPISFMIYSKPRENGFWLTLLDVGQGLSTVIQTHQHTLIFDTGPESNSFNAGVDVIRPFLLVEGIHFLDKIIISHGDWDHRGGSYALLNYYPRTPILTSIPEDFPNQNVTSCHSGQEWKWDGVSFRMLYPFPKLGFLSKNNESCVLQVCAQDNCILLTGDIEFLAEQQLVNYYGVALKSKILVVPHHGSKTSSSELFIESVHPEFALFPVGYFNRFEFPSQSILERYQVKQISVYRTDQNGAIRFLINEQTVKLVWLWINQRLMHFIDLKWSKNNS